MRRIIIITLSLLSYLASEAQVNKDFAWYDEHTYKLYQEKAWPKLIELGKSAITDGYDSYYLRMRLGIAYYEQGRYRSAIMQFEHALDFNSNPLAAEYLYYSYKFSGRTMDANLIYAKYKNQLESRDIQSPYGIITGFYTELGLKMISPENAEFGSLLYAHFGFKQQLGSRLNLYHGYMRYSQNVSQFEFVPGSGPGGVTIKETKRKYVQNEYYLRGIIPVINGLQLIGSLHTQAITDTIQYNNISYSTGFSSNLKFVDLYLAYGSSRLRGVYHHQVSAGATFYPVMSQNFYLQSVLTYHKDEEISNTIFYQKIGFRTGEKIWFELYGSFGDMRNVQEKDGFYVYNMNNHLNTRLGVTCILLVGNKVKLLFGYTNESYTEFDTELAFKQHYLFTGLQVLIKN